MNNPSKWRLVDGYRLTLTDVNPPKGWTNIYDDLGSDDVWAEMDRNFRYKMMPLFGMKEPQEGKKWVIVQAGTTDEFWVYDSIHDHMDQIKSPAGLEAIVATIDDENQGLQGIHFDQAKHTPCNIL